MKHLFTLILFIFCYFSSHAQVYEFAFENTEAVTVNNTVGTPIFSIVGALTTPNYFGGCSGQARSYAGWNTGEAFRFTSNNTGYQNSSFSACIRSSSTDVGSFEIRASIDLTNWEVIEGSFVPTTTFATYGGSLSSIFTNASVIYIEIYKLNNAGNAGNNIRIDNATLNGDVVMPVTFSKFSATPAKTTSILSFSTASETNNDFFTIERSGDGRDYDAIGEIKGSGNSNEMITYEFTDEKPFAGINYYRIKQTDFDGKYSYSDIKSVRHTSAGNLSITPRTTEGRLQVTTDMENYAIDVYNVAGQQVKSFRSLSLDQFISIDDLTAGLYYVKVNFGSQVETIKVVKI